MHFTSMATGITPVATCALQVVAEELSALPAPNAGTGLGLPHARRQPPVRLVSAICHRQVLARG